MAAELPKSTLYTVPEGTIQTSEDEDFSENSQLLEIARNYARDNFLKRPNFKNGDVIQFLDIMNGYRNSGKLIYYGDFFHILEEEGHIDEYGYVPMGIKINQFGCSDYFSESIGHNCYIWHDHATYPKESHASLPSNILDDNDYCDHPHIVYFRDGWTLITNQPDSTSKPYEYGNNNELNLDVLPAGINRNKLMFNVLERDYRHINTDEMSDDDVDEDEDYIPDEDEEMSE
jgi:hypothetical protein